jgi:hypothetical protein
MDVIMITEEMLQDVVEALVLEIDYDMHKECFKYKDDNGEMKEHLESVALNIINKKQVSKRYVFETVDDVEKKQKINVSDDFKIGFKTARIEIRQEEMQL